MYHPATLSSGLSGSPHCSAYVFLHVQRRGTDGKIIVELTPFVRTGVLREVKVLKEQQQSSVNNNDFIQTIINRLRPAIIQTVQGVKVQSTTTSTTSSKLTNEILSITPERLRSFIRTQVATILTTETFSLPDPVLVDRIAAGIQSQVIQMLEQDAKFRVVVKHKGFAQLMQVSDYGANPCHYQRGDCQFQTADPTTATGSTRSSCQQHFC